MPFAIKQRKQPLKATVVLCAETKPQVLPCTILETHWQHATLVYAQVAGSMWSMQQAADQ